MAFVVKLPWPHKALNPHAKGHWRPKAEATAQARGWAKVATLAEKVPHWPEATLFIEYYPHAYRGDVHNVAGMLKAYIDGIADGMGCDDRRLRVHYPPVWAGKKPGGEIVFRIVPPVFSPEKGGEHG